jgi:purine-binding chemotaxis protein CheW
VGELVESSEKEITDPKDILPDMPYVKGVVKLSDDLILIHDLDTFLSLEEEKTLTDALEAQGENNAG